MSECECPYCGKPINDPDECYEPSVTYDHECPHCEKNFVFSVDYIRTYDTSKAECLNGGDHDYQRTKTFPPECARLRCAMCDDEKPLSA